MNTFGARTNDDNPSVVAKNQLPISKGQHFSSFMGGLTDGNIDSLAQGMAVAHIQEDT
jgi:hypothetical protein